MSSKVTMTDVAKEAGVSKSTVSRILNGNYGQNTEKTVHKVLKVIDDMDYRPNALAKGLKGMKTNVIGIILSNLQNPFWIKVLEGVEDTCRSKGYSLMICNSNEEADIEEEHIKQFQMRQVDGIIINPTIKNLNLYDQLKKDRLPFISINRKIYGLEFDTVVVDNVSGGKLAVTHLIKLGNKKIAIFLYPTEGISPRIERLAGYKEALKDYGIDSDPELIVIAKETPGSIREKVKQLLLSQKRPDAILSTNNMMTLEILEGIKDLGLTVPDDISLIGYDETVWSKHLNPPLTTVNQPSYEMGQLAAERLISLIESNDSVDEEMKTISLEPNLIIRESCGFKEGVNIN
ncbi:LacI family DNA-binding transcriptional regulator [Paenisporosarcina indica]|uniref:LacI family DNA-binding transcriptional regulator n=1 Tax=Paenisporosarcina indica TaxID=650093 RepID=UPI00094FE955|nr:LacI family DNA-binding transcriptional regulator [Paenisporosarcina indica]